MTDFSKTEYDAKEKCLPTLRKTEILDASVSTYPTCTNLRNALPFLKLLLKSVTKKLGTGFLGNMDVIENGQTLSLTFFADAVSEFLNKDVQSWMNSNNGQIWTKLLNSKTNC